MSENFDCQTCGACCVYFHEQELRDTGSVLQAVPINPQFNNVPPKFVQIGPKLHICDSKEDAENGLSYMTTKYVRPDGAQCSALKGAVGEKVLCSIYDNRPPVCSKFKPGSEKCLDARANIL